MFKEDTKKQELIKQKQAELAAKKNPTPKQEESGATVEEINDDEAQKIQELQELAKKQAEQRAKEVFDKEAGVKTEKKEEDNLKQKPNAGNGGQTDKYVWHQTLEEVSVFLPLPMGTKANMLDVKIGVKDFKVALKQSKEVLAEG